MQEYVIEYICEDCGVTGEIRGRNSNDAWEKLDQIQKEHYGKGHRLFSWEEPGS